MIYVIYYLCPAMSRRLVQLVTLPSLDESWERLQQTTTTQSLGQASIENEWMNIKQILVQPTVPGVINKPNNRNIISFI